MTNYANFAPFDGDGRVKVYPPAIRFLQTGRPEGVTNAVARRVIDEFERHGMSNHSPKVSTLWVLITWCQRHNKPLEVWKWELGGYSIFLNKIHQGVSQEGGHKVLSLGDLDGR
jgi:hypothetical protein